MTDVEKRIEAAKEKIYAAYDVIPDTWQERISLLVGDPLDWIEVKELAEIDVLCYGDKSNQKLVFSLNRLEQTELKVLTGVIIHEFIHLLHKPLPPGSTLTASVSKQIYEFFKTEFTQNGTLKMKEVYNQLRDEAETQRFIDDLITHGKAVEVPEGQPLPLDATHRLTVNPITGKRTVKRE